MSTLSIKLRRDIILHKYQFFSIVTVVLLGIALFAASHDSYKNLRLSYYATHKILHFADLTFGPSQFNDKQLNQVIKLRDVAGATGRINVDIPIKLSTKKKILGRAISYPIKNQPAVNKLSIFKGSYFKPKIKYQVLVEKHFAQFHHLGIGDKIEILLHSSTNPQPKWRKFTVTGIVISPEYIWVTRSRQDVMPSPDNFGVLFVPQSILQKSLGSSSQFKYNELVVQLKNGASISSVKQKIQKISSFNSSIPVLAKKDQPGNATLKEDLDGFNELSVFFPFVFLSIGAMAIYIMLTRMVHTQRAQIGILRANGYSRWSIIGYYLSFGLIVGIIGSVLGVIIGISAGGTITRFYTSMLAIPIVKINFYPDTALTAVVIALLSVLIGVWAPAHTASKIKPATAMRGETPSSGGRKSLAEKLIPFLTYLSTQWKIPLRGMGRNRRRSLSTILGVVFAIVLILMSWGMLDTTNYLLDRQFNYIQKQDLKVYFSQPLSKRQITIIAKLPGVEKLEPLTELPVNLKHGGKHYSTVLQAMPTNTKMHQFYFKSGTKTKLSNSGLLVGKALREKLNLKKGEAISLKIMNKPVKIKIAGFLNEALGTYAYISLTKLQHYLPPNQRQNFSSAQIKVKKDKLTRVKNKLAKLPEVAGVEDSRALYKTIKKFNKLFYGFVGVMLAFGGIMAFALIFNTMTVNIFERSREIATLKTLGIGKRRISHLITTENILLVIVGTAPGLLVGYYMSKIAMNQFSSDLFSFDLYIYPLTYVYCALIIVVVALVSQWPALRAVHRLNLAKVIKERST